MARKKEQYRARRRYAFPYPGTSELKEQRTLTPSGPRGYPVSNAVKKFFTLKQVGENENGGGNGLLVSNQKSREYRNKNEHLPVTTINLSSEEPIWESEEAIRGTAATMLSSQPHRGTPGFQFHRMPSVTSKNAHGSSSQRNKRKLVDGDHADCASSATTATESVGKKFIWTHEEEISLLCAMLQFTNKKGYYPKKSSDMDVLHDMVTEGSSYRFRSRLKKDQMANKARSMRSRHFRIREMVENGSNLTENEHAVFNIGNLIWATKIKRMKKAGGQEDLESEVVKVKGGGGGKSSSKSSPCHPTTNSKVTVDKFHVLDFLTQLFVSSGNHGIGYSRDYLQNMMSVLASTKRKAVEEICKEIQEEERQRDFRRLKASLEIIKIFNSSAACNF